MTLVIENAGGARGQALREQRCPRADSDPPNAPVPLYWYRPPQVLGASAGMHRFIWDLHYQPLPDAAGAPGGGRGGLPIQAIPYNTAPATATPFVSPGSYRVKLTVDGKTLTQPIIVKQDPRVKTPAVTMQQVYTLTNALYFGAADAHAAADVAGSWREQTSKMRASASGEVATALDDFGRKAAMLAGAPPSAGGGRGGRGGGGAVPAPATGTGGSDAETLWAVRSQLSGLMNSMQAADVAPTANTLAAITTARATAARVMARWNGLRTVDLSALNGRLKAAGLGQIQ